MDTQHQQEMTSTVEALNAHIRTHEISDFRINCLEGDLSFHIGHVAYGAGQSSQEDTSCS